MPANIAAVCWNIYISNQEENKSRIKYFSYVTIGHFLGIESDIYSYTAI